jgi:hypothetical protein
MSVADSAEIDKLYDTLADVARAIARHLPEGAPAPETLTAGIKAVAEHAFAQGAANAMAAISDALGGHDLDPVEHIGDTQEAE